MNVREFNILITCNKHFACETCYTCDKLLDFSCKTHIGKQNVAEPLERVNDLQMVSIFHQNARHTHTHIKNQIALNR